MAEQKSRQQTRTAEEERRQQDAERSEDWADRAARARTADDPAAMAPRDAGGRPSNGRQF